MSGDLPQVGDSASMTRAFTEQDVADFARLSGDDNPLHLDEEYAKGTRFGRRIVHGALLSGLISALLGTRLPGPGTIYLRQELKFLSPAYIGEEVTAEVVVEYVTERRRVMLSTTIHGADGRAIADGGAEVKA